MGGYHAVCARPCAEIGASAGLFSMLGYRSAVSFRKERVLVPNSAFLKVTVGYVISGSQYLCLQLWSCLCIN